MTVATNSSFWFIRSLSRQRTVHQARNPHPLLSRYIHRLPPAINMFKRANAAYEARNKASKPQPPLAKQLSSSSSQSPRHDANIRDQSQNVKRIPSSIPRSNASQQQAAMPALALQPRSFNASQFARPPSSKAFASLYDTQSSFQEEPGYIDLTNDDGDHHRRSTKSTAAVEIFDDDFSDDDNLDLDYELPTALPQPPRAQPGSAQATVPSPDARSSTLSWSQSSPPDAHAGPHAGQTIAESAIPQTSTKRSFPETDSRPKQPVAKKRVLPAQVRQSRQANDENTTLDAHATPATNMELKGKPLQTWDLTSETVKAQQKKMKDKTKKTNATTAEATAQEMQHAVKSHVVRQAAISLSNEQELVKDLVCNDNKSVFFTGPAGTGKSVLMRAIIAQLKKKYAKDPERLAVTASTGLAACNIGGMTLHSFSGIGLGKDDVQTLVRKIRRNPKAKTRWLKTKVLIIDEISMVDGDLFDKLSQIGRTLRNNGRPWGGIQLVITGDFFQLPPVPDMASRDVKFAFEAATWNTSIDHTIGLTEVFRQKDPGMFQQASYKAHLLTMI